MLFPQPLMPLPPGGSVPAALRAVCALANNHVLDFGRPGLADTLRALSGAGLRAAGAGPDGDAARRAAAVPVPGGRRAVIMSCGTASSGIPAAWAAAPGRPGVNLLPDLSAATADDVIGQVQAARRPGDVAVVSIHWGSNWGYDVDADQVRFARRLIDGGVDLVHGHSSHHPRPIEVFRGKLILYGCGDCIDDYEGITGHRAYRGDLRLLYFASLEAGTGRLAALRMAPMRARKMRLHHAPATDRQWLSAVLDRISRDFAYHAPHGDQVTRYTSLRETARFFAIQIVNTTPVSREQSLALTKLDEVVTWANAAIARNEAEQ